MRSHSQISDGSVKNTGKNRSHEISHPALPHVRTQAVATVENKTAFKNAIASTALFPKRYATKAVATTGINADKTENNNVTLFKESGRNADANSRATKLP